MSTQTNPAHEPNPTLLAALYQVTARWYANDAQLVWRRLTLFVTLNTGLIAAQVFASQLHVAIRIALPLLGVIFSSAGFFCFAACGTIKIFRLPSYGTKSMQWVWSSGVRIVALTQSGTNLRRSIFPA